MPDPMTPMTGTPEEIVATARLTTTYAVQQLAKLYEATAKERDDAKDELRTIQRLVKMDGVEDFLSHQAESDTAFRLRLFAAVATLRVELLANGGHGQLVQRVCEQAVANLQRAEAAERELAALKLAATTYAEHLEIVTRERDEAKAKADDFSLALNVLHRQRDEAKAALARVTSAVEAQIHEWDGRAFFSNAKSNYGGEMRKAFDAALATEPTS